MRRSPTPPLPTTPLPPAPDDPAAAQARLDRQRADLRDMLAGLRAQWHDARPAAPEDREWLLMRIATVTQDLAHLERTQDPPGEAHPLPTRTA